MATRKNRRFIGASARAAQHHADKWQLRYQRKQARGTLALAADRRDRAAVMAPTNLRRVGRGSG